VSCGVGGGHVLLCVWCGFVNFLFYFFIFILSHESWQIKVTVNVGN
jgi:hypothetical protein